MPGGKSGKIENFFLSVCLSVGLSICLYHNSGQSGRQISLKLGKMIGFDST